MVDYALVVEIAIPLFFIGLVYALVKSSRSQRNKENNSTGSSINTSAHAQPVSTQNNTTYPNNTNSHLNDSGILRSIYQNITPNTGLKYEHADLNKIQNQNIQSRQTIPKRIYFSKPKKSTSIKKVNDAFEAKVKKQFHTTVLPKEVKTQVDEIKAINNVLAAFNEGRSDNKNKIINLPQTINQIANIPDKSMIVNRAETKQYCEEILNAVKEELESFENDISKGEEHNHLVSGNNQVNEFENQAQALKSSTELLLNNIQSNNVSNIEKLAVKVRENFAVFTEKATTTRHALTQNITEKIIENESKRIIPLQKGVDYHVINDKSSSLLQIPIINAVEDEIKAIETLVISLTKETPYLHDSGNKPTSIVQIIPQIAYQPKDIVQEQENEITKNTEEILTIIKDEIATFREQLPKGEAHSQLLITYKPINELEAQAQSLENEASYIIRNINQSDNIQRHTPDFYEKFKEFAENLEKLQNSLKKISYKEKKSAVKKELKLLTHKQKEKEKESELIDDFKKRLSNLSNEYEIINKDKTLNLFKFMQKIYFEFETTTEIQTFQIKHVEDELKSLVKNLYSLLDTIYNEHIAKQKIHLDLSSDDDDIKKLDEHIEKLKFHLQDIKKLNTLENFSKLKQYFHNFYAEFFSLCSHLNSIEKRIKLELLESEKKVLEMKKLEESILKPKRARLFQFNPNWKRKLARAAAALVIFTSTFGATSKVMANIGDLKNLNNKQSVQQVLAVKEADFGNVNVPDDVKLMANLENQRNTGLPFIIQTKDTKHNISMYVFAKDGKLISHTASLIGRDLGDDLTEEEKKLGIDETRNGHKKTPSGRFEADMKKSKDYGTTINFVKLPKCVIAIHKVYTGTPSENRVGRLDSETALDNRISFGCINVPEKFYNEILEKHFSGKSIVILPDSTPLFAKFPELKSTMLATNKDVIKSFFSKNIVKDDVSLFNFG